LKKGIEQAIVLPHFPKGDGYTPDNIYEEQQCSFYKNDFHGDLDVYYTLDI
jgi:hypothetical protein